MTPPLAPAAATGWSIFSEGTATWVMLRAAGIGSYLMLFGSVAWGIVATTGPFGRKVSKATAVAIHQFLSTVGLLLLGVHLAGLLMDRFVPFKPLDLIIPMHGTFRPLAVTFGIVAMYAMVAVLASSWARKGLGTTLWRRLHLLAVPAFAAGLVHGVFAGTDTIRPWMWLTYVLTGAMVMFLILVRAMTVGLRPQRAARPKGAPVRLPGGRAPKDRPAMPRPATTVSPGRASPVPVGHLPSDA